MSTSMNPASPYAVPARPIKGTPSRLPSAFVGHPPARIKRKARVKPGFHSLPFVASPRAKTNTPCWEIPATGGYFGGYETGEAMAHALLKFMREDKGAFPAYWLTSVAESLMVRFEEEGGAAMKVRARSAEWSEGFDSLRGQYVGFFNTLGQWLSASAKELGSNLDRIQETDLIARANAGLGFDALAFKNSLTYEG